MQSNDLRGTRASVDLDAIRAISAIAVVFSHARVLLIKSASPGMSISSRLPYLLSGYGHSAVIIFFVLSGFLIGSGVIRAVDSQKWSWRKYLAARGVRLYLVLIPALFMTVILDHIGLRMIESCAPNQDTALAIVTANQIADHSGTTTLLGNLVFLQTIATPNYGSNTALWSLANEAWYYLIFPCFWLAIQGDETPRRRIGYVVIGIAMLAFVGPKMRMLFPTWLFGVFLAVLPRVRRRLPRMLTPIAALPLMGVLLLVGTGRLRPESDLALYSVALTFTPFLYVVLHHVEPSRESLYTRVATALSCCSYSLYLTHLPLLILMRAAWTYETPWAADAEHWLFVLLACLICIVYAYGFAFLTEANTEKVRLKLMDARRTLFEISQV